MCFAQFECERFAGEIKGEEDGFCRGFTEQEHVGIPGVYPEL